MEVEVVTEATEPKTWKRPRGYVSLRKRLLWALKHGGSLSQIMGDEKHTMTLARLRDGLRIHKSSLSEMAKAITAWEKRNRIRKRDSFSGRYVRKPAAVAAKKASPNNVEIVAFEAMLKLTSEQRERVLAYLDIVPE